MYVCIYNNNNNTNNNNDDSNNDDDDDDDDNQTVTFLEMGRKFLLTCAKLCLSSHCCCYQSCRLCCWF